jgi:RNA polymerase sigma-70 factor (ECF subfamily)
MGKTVSEETFVRTYRQTVGELYGYVASRCGHDRGLAEDITQEAWLRAVATWPKKGLPDEPLAWLKTVARNLLLNYFRRSRPISLDSLPSGWEPGMVDNGFDIDTPGVAALVSWGLSRLRPRQAELLEAFYFNGHKMAKIASDTGLTERAVEGRLRRARIQLRQYLESALKSNGEEHD